MVRFIYGFVVPCRSAFSVYLFFLFLLSITNIMVHLDEYKLLSDRQHAFRKGHICETQLTTVINDWAKILDNRGHIGF